MRLFKRSVDALGSAELQQWRGRSAEILDAGPLPWQLVLEALKVSADAVPEERAGTDLRPVNLSALGVRLVESTHRDVYQGERYRRPVLVDLGSRRPARLDPRVVWVSAATESFVAVANAGRLSVQGPAPAEVATFLGGLSEQPSLWRDLHVVGGLEGIVVERLTRTDLHLYGWVLDLWLAEHLAHLAAYTALPAPDPLTASLPYGLARSTAR